MIVNWLMTLANWTQQLRQIVALPSPAVIIFLPQRHHNMTQITLHFRPLHLRSILLTVIHSTPPPLPSYNPLQNSSRSSEIFQKFRKQFSVHLYFSFCIVFLIVLFIYDGSFDNFPAQEKNCSKLPYFCRVRCFHGETKLLSCNYQNYSTPNF